MIPLTARQAEIHAFICAHLRERGAPPTLREIAEHFGMGSTNAVTCHLRAIERRGYIDYPTRTTARLPHDRTGPHRPSSIIRVLHSDDGRPIILGVSPVVRDELLKFHDEVVEAIERKAAS